MIEHASVTLLQYHEYLDKLERDGFLKVVDNGMEGLGGFVYTALYQKEDIQQNVIYLRKLNKMYVKEEETELISEYLFPRTKDLAQPPKDAKTTLTMMEMYDWGSSFILQLKNGNYILNDGGRIQDLPYLFDYIDEHTPKGKKPVIEAWFVTHAHPDHIGCLSAAVKEPKYRDRVFVEGFYYNEPSEVFCKKKKCIKSIEEFKKACSVFRTQKGLVSQLYCPEMGQRFYFDDITVDIVFTHDICPLEDMKYANFNDTSTWLLYTIEGQTVLIPGDADVVTLQKVMTSYDETFFDLDVLVAFHHGIDVFQEVGRYFTCKTLLYPFGTTKHKLWRPNVRFGNALLQEKTSEYMSYGAGTKVLTFPYGEGETEVLPLIQWKYHPERDVSTLHHPEREVDQVMKSEKNEEKMWVIPLAFEGSERWHDVLRYLQKCGMNTALIELSGEWNREMLEVELRWLRIRGVTPLPLFDFTNIPARRQRKLIDELIDVFSKPEYIHMGTISKEILPAFSVCIEYGVKPWIWVDTDSINKCGGWEWFVKHVPKDTLITNTIQRSIRASKEEDELRIGFYRELADRGYEQVPLCATWEYHYCDCETIRCCREVITEEHIKGYMSATNLHVTEAQYAETLNDVYLLGQIKDKMYPRKY